MSEQYTIEQISINDIERWNTLLYKSLYPSYRQSISYEHSKEANGRKINTFICQKNGGDIAGVHYSIRRSKFNLLSTADILSGIVFKVEPTVELLDYIISHFISFAKSNKVAYVRITPWLPEKIAGEKTDYELLFNQVLLNKGFDIIKKGRHTYWIDLSKSEKDIFSNFDKPTRNRVRKGIKEGLHYKFVKEYYEQNFDEFWNVYKELGQKKSFRILSRMEMKVLVQSLFKDKLGELVFIKFNNSIVFSNLIGVTKLSSGLYSATNHEYKNLRGCPPPGQYAYWIIIKEMKKKGFNYYDLGFSPGPIPIKGHPLYDIWRFKYGFGGNHVEFLPTYGKVIKPIRGRIFKLLRDKK